MQAVIRDRLEHQWYLGNGAIPDYRVENPQYINNWHKFRYCFREGDGRLVGSLRKGIYEWYTIHEKLTNAAMGAYKEEDDWGAQCYVICLFNSIQDTSSRVVDLDNPLFEEEFPDRLAASTYLNSL